MRQTLKKTALLFLFCFGKIQNTAAYPIGFKRMFNPETKICVDLISDLHGEPYGSVPSDRHMGQYVKLFSHLLENADVIFEYHPREHIMSSSTVSIHDIAVKLRERLEPILNKSEDEHELSLKIKAFVDIAAKIKSFMDFENSELARFCDSNHLFTVLAEKIQNNPNFISSDLIRNYDYCSCYFHIEKSCRFQYDFFTGEKEQYDSENDLESKMERLMVTSLLLLDFLEEGSRLNCLPGFIKEKICEQYAYIVDHFSHLVFHDWNEEEQKALNVIFPFPSFHEINLIFDIIDYEIMNNIEISKHSKKIVYAGAAHCRNISKLLKKSGFVCAYSLNAPSWKKLERMIENLDSKINSAPCNKQTNVFVDTGKEFSFYSELDFEVLRQALLQDPQEQYIQYYLQSKKRQASDGARGEGKRSKANLRRADRLNKFQQSFIETALN